MLAVKDVRRCDVVQGVMLQRWGGRVKLRAQRQRVGGAVSGGGADGADSFRGGFEGHRRTLMETVLFTSEEEEEELEQRAELRSAAGNGR